MNDDRSGTMPPEVVPLGTEAPAPPATRPLRGTHRWAVTGMALFALVGIAATIAFVTVSWGDAGRLVSAIIVLSVVAFLACAAAAVFTAARDTYARDTGARDEERTRAGD